MPYLVDPVVPPGRMSSREQPVLRVADLLLRPFATRDVDALIGAYADSAIQRWHARRLDSHGEARGLIDDWNRRWLGERAARWAVVEPNSDRLLGQVGLRSIHLADGGADISYWLVPEGRGRGVATQSLQAVSDWAFEDLGVHRLEVHHAVANADSCRVAQRAGFTLEGTMLGKALHADGWHDMHLHSQLRTGRAGP